MANGQEVARANPLRVVKPPPLRRYWGDLHGQSGETIGMGSAEAYFRYARDPAFIDMVGHQGNDFQITDAFWKKLNRLTAEFDKPGQFVCLPGYEWSGNTGMGGDRNIFYRREGRPIRRSSHILVEGQTSTEAIYTADELFRALEGEDVVVIAHVGGAMPISSTPMMAGLSARWRCTRPGALLSGCCTMHSRRVFVLASYVTATITRGDPAIQGPALQPSVQSAGSPAISCRN